MNEKEKQAFDLWKRNEAIDTTEMSIVEVMVLWQQQDRLYQYAHSRLDKQFFKRELE